MTRTLPFKRITSGGHCCGMRARSSACTIQYVPAPSRVASMTARTSQIRSLNVSMAGRLAWLWAMAEEDRAFTAWIRAEVFFRV